MPLPSELINIFTYKQKSYKMVLILSILDAMKETGQRQVSMIRVREHFLQCFQEREAKSLRVDGPPSQVRASRWADVQLNRVQYVMNTPIKALSSILEVPSDQYTIGFKQELYDQWDQQVLDELYQFTLDELELYYAQPPSSFSLRDDLLHMMTNYLQAKTEPFRAHLLGQYMRKTIPEHIKSLQFIYNYFQVQGSVGQGNWANVPWIAIMHRQVTDSTQKGLYVTYLFAEDMRSVYLVLQYGVTDLKNKLGTKKAYEHFEQKAREIRAMMPNTRMNTEDPIYLGESGYAKDYAASTIAHFHYEIEDMPNNEQMVDDLWDAVETYLSYVQRMGAAPSNEWANNFEEVVTESPEEEPDSVVFVRDIEVKETLHNIQEYISQRGFYFPESLTHNFYLSMKSRPFVILAGISGTGKTRLVRLFAEAVGATIANGQFHLISVRPDWSDPADLIGYKDLSGNFKPGPLMNVFVEASKEENRRKPYFVCLDEMNLARVEHYFSDMMSLLETQAWQDSSNDTQQADNTMHRGRIVTAPLFATDTLNTEEDQSRYGNLGIPENVYIVGTVNMDETTYPFSKRVLDRANTIEFNAIDLMQLPRIAEDSQQLVEVVPVEQSFLRSDYLQLIDALGDYEDLIRRTTEQLVQVNHILEDIHAHVGFRIRDAVCFYLVYNERFGLMTEEAAFDLQLLQKILPRIQGSQSGVRRVLVDLLKLCLTGNTRIPSPLEDDDAFWRQWSRGGTPPAARYPESARKLVYMIRRLDEDGFTSYWVS
ncbi:ATPase [Paenibacillus bovis]|uniref:ATPase n=2 Tax=Paenibacillus bovis TaxID=1616788 RepID=A0A172ZDR5_9BACL|nr:ATPase [Paenibacillus bovis]